MDIYISKKCPHCKNLLIIFYNNKYLIQYFNIIDVEGTQIPNFITSVPTLVYNEELYFDNRMYDLIDSVNQHHLKQNGGQQGQQSNNMGQQSNNMGQQSNNMGQQQSNNMGQQSNNMGPPLGTQSLGQNMNDMRTSNLNAPSQPNMQQPNMQQKSDNPTKQIDKPKEDGEIEGVCWGEDCTYENISDDKGNNNLMQQYCFLDDGYSSEKPTGPNNSSSTGEKEGRFDNNAYEQMMKSRGGM